MQPEFPRLLVATEFPPNASGGGPAVVRQMLKGWPAERLFWWSCLPERNQHFGQCIREIHCASIPAKLLPNRKLTGLKSQMLETFWTPWAASHLTRTLKTEAPDVVWIIPHNWSILPIAKAMNNWRGRFHVTMQDYVDVHGNPQRFGSERCRRMMEQADHLYASATTRDATSHPMITDLRERTGKDATQMLHAGLEASDFEFLAKPSRHGADSIRIVYAGTILVEEVFGLFISAIEEIRAALSKPVQLHLCGAHSYAGRSWFNREWMFEHGNLPEAELLGKLRECDWGFAPMALTDKDPRYNRFSFPTKFITYLAAGLPVITLGDRNSSVMKMAANYDVGLCTNTADAGALAEQLKTILSIESPRERYGPEIVRCAREEFDSDKMRRNLYRCLSGE